MIRTWHRYCLWVTLSSVSRMSRDTGDGEKEANLAEEIEPMRINRTSYPAWGSLPLDRKNNLRLNGRNRKTLLFNPLRRLLMYVTTSDFNWAKSLETHHMARYQHSINSFDWCWSSVEWSSRNLMQWHSERTRPVPEWTWTLGSFSNDEGNDKGNVALPKINIIPLCSHSTMLEKYAKTGLAFAPLN